MDDGITVVDSGTATFTGGVAIHGAPSEETNMTTEYAIQIEPLPKRWAIFRRAWFLVSAIPRYLFTGNVRLP